MIRAQVTFDESVSVSGDPALTLTIGGSEVPAAYDAVLSDGASLVFGYEVRHGDRDADGLSIGADAVDLGDATIRNDAGVDADVSLGAHAVENLGDQLVVGTPPMRACADERTLALGHDAQFGRYGMVAEWDGTPFRVDMVRNFPDFVTDADLQQLLDPIGRLADQIETQLGYRILEMGDLIDVPAGAPPGWDQEFSRYSHSHLVRERGQIVVFYMNDDNPDDWDGLGGSPMSGHPCCGTITYKWRPTATSSAPTGPTLTVTPRVCLVKGTLASCGPAAAWDPRLTGRLGVDVSAPGDRVVTTFAPRSHWATFPHLLIEDGGGLYGLAGAVSAAAPIVTGIIALMLEVDPTLDALSVKRILQETARSDEFTGPTPNPLWGHGKVDAFEALMAVRAQQEP